MTSIMIISILVFTLSLYLLGGTVAAQTQSNHVSRDLFNSLEELSRIVDISYCVGMTGVQRPFQCLSRCDDFPDFELIAVSAYYLRSGQQLNIPDMEHGDPPF